MALKSDSKKSWFLKNMHFLCDAINFKQGKSLPTVSDEVYRVL